MKLRAIFIFFAALIPVLSGCATVRVDMPNLAGLTAPKAAIGVENATPYWVEIVAMSSNLGYLGPGASIFDREPVPFEGADLPVMARIYSPEGELLGIAAEELHLWSGQDAFWRIQGREIVWLGCAKPDEPRESRVQDRRVDFPRAILRSSTMVQVANATCYDAVLKINGAPVARLESGDIYYFSTAMIGRGYGRHVVTLQFVDGDRVVGLSPERRFYTADHSRPVAYQFVFGPRDVERD